MTKKTEYLCLLVFFIGLFFIGCISYSSAYAAEIIQPTVPQFSAQDIKNAKIDKYADVAKWQQQIVKVKNKYKNSYKQN